MKSVYGKLIGGFLITILFSFSVAGYIALENNVELITQNAYEELISSNEFVVEMVEVLGVEQSMDLLIDYADASQFEIYISDDDGTMLRFGTHLTHNDIDLDEIDAGNGTLTFNDNVVSYGNAYMIDGKTVYIVSFKDISYDRSAFLDSALLILGCVFLSGSVIFLAIADFIVKPITRLTNATNELSKGNYHVRVNYSGDDEISKLNQGFNRMAVQLSKHEETRQKFISDISHEFQTPLTAIQGFSKILRDEELPKAQREKYADIIFFHSKRLSTLSKNMLQLTLLDNDDATLELMHYSIIDQLNRVISTYENTASTKNIEIVFEKNKKDVEIYGDEARLEQVWINLLSNAIKYTGENGLITISARRAGKDVEVKIEDTGSGMSNENISHIFKRFYREDRSRSVEGNGLGLAIVKSIVDLHQGNIDVISEVDVGSTFVVKIPCDKQNKIIDKLTLK